MAGELRKLLQGHFWRTREGCKTIVLDRGAVQFDYPRSWTVEPCAGSVTLFDRRPPADESRIDVSYFRLPPVDWSGLPVADLIDGVTSKERDNATPGPLREEFRRGIELAWRNVRFVAPGSQARACFRVCVARHRSIHCLITCEFHGANPRADEIWETILDTLVLDRPVHDVARGV